MVVVGGFALVGSQVRVTNNLYEAFSADDPLVEANQHLERHFNGGVPFSILVRWQAGVDPLRPEVLSMVRELADLDTGLVRRRRRVERPATTSEQRPRLGIRDRAVLDDLAADRHG